MTTNFQSFDAGRGPRVLIVRMGAMGDVLHAMPAVAALRERHPEWFVGWVIEPRWEPLLRVQDAASRGAAMPLVDRTFLAAAREWKKHPLGRETIADISALRLAMQAERFDLCVDMQGLIRTAVIGRMAGAERFVGRARPREGPARWLYKERVRARAPHVIEQGCELLGAAVGETLSPVRVTLPVDEVAEASLSQKLASDKPIVLLAPTAGWGAKEWPAERYGAVAEALGHAGFRVVVNASSAEEPTAKAVVAASDGCAVALPGTMAELIALVRRVEMVIAGDTGPLHLAAALGKPVVALFGPTDPLRTGPYGTRSRVLRHAESRTDHSRHAAPECGLLQITVDEVVSAAFELLQTVKTEDRVR